MAETMVLEGLDELDNALRRLSDEVQQKAIKKAARAGATVIRQAVRQATPTGPTMNLRKSTTKREVTYRNSGMFLIVMGHRWPIGAHAHLVEAGTKERYRFAGRAKRLAARGKMKKARYLRDERGGRNRGGYTGRVTGRPFVEPAFHATKGSAFNTVAKVLADEIDKIAGRVGRD